MDVPAGVDHFTVLVWAIGIVLAAAIPATVTGIVTWRKTQRIEMKANRIDEQVSNNHDVNLREEADHRHAEQTRKLDIIGDAVIRIQADVSHLLRNDRKQDDRLGMLEQGDQNT